MGDKKLMTLKEIADELGVNYKTVHHYKEVFEEFVAIQFRGRRVKYLPVNIDLFSKILELKDEGYCNDDIDDVLRIWSSDNLKVYLSDDPSDGPTDNASDYPSNHPSGYRSDCPSGCLSDHRSEDLPNPLTDGPDDTQPIDHLTQLKADLLAETPNLVKQHLDQSLEDRLAQVQSGLEDSLRKLVGAFNGSLTQFYKSISKLNHAVQVIEQRLGNLESDLGTVNLECIDLAEEIDLDQIQISFEGLGLVDNGGGGELVPFEVAKDQAKDHQSPVDLEFVRQSICNGRPDRDTVIQWIRMTKEREPEISYGDLAKRLDDGGIPTMRGKSGWHRGTIRTLHVAGNQIKESNNCYQ